jgi:hypothetical protein
LFEVAKSFGPDRMVHEVPGSHRLCFGRIDIRKWFSSSASLRSRWRDVHGDAARCARKSQKRNVPEQLGVGGTRIILAL